MPTPVPTPTPLLVEIVGQPADFDWINTFLPVVSLLAGAAIAYLSTRAADNRKAKLDTQRRWSEESITRAGKFMAAREKAHSRLKEFQRLYKATPNPVTPETLAQFMSLKERYEAAFSDLILSGQELSLVAPLDVRQVCRDIPNIFNEMIRNDTADDLETVTRMAAMNKTIIERVRQIAEVPDYKNAPAATVTS